MRPVHWKALSLALIFSFLIVSMVGFALIWSHAVYTDADCIELIRLMQEHRVSVTFAQASSIGFPLFLNTSVLLLIGLGLFALITLILYLVLRRFLINR